MILCSVYNFLLKVVSNLTAAGFFFKCIDRRLQLVSDEELHPYLACLQIVHEMARRLGKVLTAPYRANTFEILQTQCERSLFQQTDLYSFPS
jgi:hypothetical protein